MIKVPWISEVREERDREETIVCAVASAAIAGNTPSYRQDS